MQIFLLQIIFIGFFFTGFQFFSVAGYGVTILDFALLAFYIYAFKKLIWDGIQIKYSYNIFHLILFGLFVSIILSSTTAIYYGETEMIFQYFKSFVHFIELFLFGIICIFLPIDLSKWDKVIKTWLILGLLINIFGIYQIIARALDLPLAWIVYNNVSFMTRATEEGVDSFNQLSLHYGDFFRATSIFSEPSALGTFNTYMLAFLIVPIINKQKHFFKSKIIIYIMLIFASIGMLLAFSMTGFVGAILIFTGLLLVQKKHQIIRYSTLILSFIVIITLADLLFSEYVGVSVIELFQQRIEGIFHFATSAGNDDKQVFGESFGSRLNTYQQSVDIWKQYPIQGIGLGLTSFNKVHPELVFSDFTTATVLAELGTIGFIFLVAFFVSLMIIAIKLTKNEKILSYFNEYEQRLIRLLYYIIIVQIIINFISGNNFSSPNLWLPIGLVLSVINFSYLKMNKNTRSLRFVKTPLKTVLDSYIHKKNSSLQSRNK
jgi:hypothetical protein